MGHAAAREVLYCKRFVTDGRGALHGDPYSGLTVSWTPGGSSARPCAASARGPRAVR